MEKLVGRLPIFLGVFGTNWAKTSTVLRRDFYLIIWAKKQTDLNVLKY